VRGVELLLEAGGRRVRLTAALPAVERRLVDAAFVKDRPREQIAAWLQLLVAMHDAPDAPWIEEAVVIRRAGVAADGKKQKGPVRHVLRVKGEDVEERRAAASAALLAVVDLALQVREAPQPLLGRTSWLLDAPGVAVTNLRSELTADLYDPSTVLVLGRLADADLVGLHTRTRDGRIVTASELAATLRAAHRSSLAVTTETGA
jgi:hypothetical protein